MLDIPNYVLLNHIATNTTQMALPQQRRTGLNGNFEARVHTHCAESGQWGVSGAQQQFFAPIKG